MAQMKPRRNLSDTQIKQAKADLEELIKIAGSVQSLADNAGVSKQQVYNWAKKGYISATGAAKICNHQKYIDAGFTKQSLCPDVKIWYL